MHPQAKPLSGYRPGSLTRRAVLQRAVAAAGAGTLGTAFGQAWPSRPIRVLIPASVGTTSDIVARILAAPMEKALGQPLVIEAAPGAGGVTATDRMVRSAKDGYTLALASNNHVIFPSIYKNIPFDSLKDISPISVVGKVPLIILAHPSVPARNTQELIALAKSRPGELNYGSPGNGTAPHLAGVMFVSEGGVDIKHVPYKGFAPMLTDLLGGQIQLGVASVASVADHVRTGRLTAIGVSTLQRTPTLPNVPTFAESGLPNYNLDGWVAFIGPAGLPRPVIDRLNGAVLSALAQKEVQDALAAQAVMVVGDSPESATRFFQTEREKHARLVKSSGATLE